MSNESATVTAGLPLNLVVSPFRNSSVRRYYDPATGQFLSVDPLVDETEAPYAYVDGDPVDVLDPSGLGVGSWLNSHIAQPFLGATTALGNDIANSPIAAPFLSVTTDIGTALGGGYYDFASAHPCIALGISTTAQIAGLFFFPEELGLEGLAAEESSTLIRLGADESWANPRTLEDHFLRHGFDLGAGSAEQYAAEASRFLQRAQAEGLPTKIGADGTIRVYDPATNTFGSYTPSGLTKTFFKPSSSTYWSRQPGTLVP